MGSPVGAERAGVEVGLDAAEGLAGQDVQLDADQRAGRRVEDAVRGGGAAEPVAEVAAGVADALHLGVLAVRVGDLQVAGLDLARGRAPRRAAACRSARSSSPTSSLEVVGDHEVGAVAA